MRVVLAIAVACSLLALSQLAEPRPGQYCTSTRDCAPLELCVTADPWASSGTCQRLKLLP
jgi:hypothetical protein